MCLKGMASPSLASLSAMSHIDLPAPWLLPVVAIAVAAFLIVFAVSKARTGKERRVLPPGPKGLPVIGNAHQLPISFVERTLFKWAKRYGASYLSE